MNSDAVIMITFLAYFLSMLFIGSIAWIRTKTSQDFFLGGRSLGPWTTAMSAGASDMSGWLLLGLPGFVFLSGLEAVWLGGGLLIGSWLNWLVVAKRLRVYSVLANDSVTLPEYFSNRFDNHKGLIQPIAASFILIFYLFYTSSGLVAGGKLFQSAFGIDYHWALVIGTLSVISYTLFGGFLAVCWTDLVQGLLMSAALLIVPIMALEVSGGPSAIFHQINEINPELLNMFTTNTGQSLSIIIIISLAGWGLGYFGQPHILARFKAVNSLKQLPMARRIAVSWTFLSILGALLVGFAGIVYVKNTGLFLDDPEAIFMLMVNTLFHPVIAGILLAAILAAIMSTADSQLLVCSTAFAEDFYRDLFRIKASQKEIILVGRCAIMGVSVIATTMAWDPDSSVLKLVSYAWAGFGAAFGPTLILSLYWRRMTSSGAMSGIITGALTVFCWSKLHGGLFDLYELVPGILFSTVAIISVSYLTKPPSKKITDTFDTMLSEIKCKG
ncbi:MAG: sodium/proline symporter PutP [Endozoicomonas sp. (ex Botrylloides leachii)]|nr:sodium/proline symporter PutP [Endozoicomonas sp. (ex Botrylloides leachii)]